MINPKDYFAGHAHSCDVGIACAVGLEAAHVFNHIVYWLKNNASKNKAKIINNRHWMYETQKEISDCLGYLSEDQVCRAIKKLVDFGFLIAENHHEDKFKKTNWYAIFDDHIFLKDIGNKKMFTKPRNRGIEEEEKSTRENEPTDGFGRSAISRNGDRESAECIYKEQEDKLHNYKTTTTPTPSFNDLEKPKLDSVVVVSSDSEKVNAMQALKLSENVIERSLRFSLEEIKTAIECCLNESKPIDTIDGYFLSALKEKWQPKPNKAKSKAFKEENLKQQQQERQRIYADAKQLEITHKYNLKDTASFSVTENSITIKINAAFSPLELTDESLQILKKYIKENQKNVPTR